MEKSRKEQEEEARVLMVEAQIEYSEIQKKIAEAREILPEVNERTPEETVFWLSLCLKASKCSKEAIATRKRYKRFSRPEIKSTGTIGRVQELMSEVDLSLEKKEIEKQLNPNKLSVFDLKGTADIIRGLNLSPEENARLKIPSTMKYSLKTEPKQELTSEEIDAESDRFLEEDLGGTENESR